MRKVTVLLSVAFVLFATQIFAQMAVHESFDYTAGTSLDDSPGTAGNGWDGSWFKQDGTEGFATVAEAGIVWGDLDPIPHQGNELKYSVPGDWAASRYMRPLATTLTDEEGAEYWMSFVYQTSDIPTGNTYYLTKLYHYAEGVDTAEVVAVGKSGGGTTYSCGSGWAGGSGPDVSDVQATTDPVWFVMKIVASGDTSVDRTYMWINPDPAGGVPDTMDADVARDSYIPDAGIDHLAFENGGEMAMDIYFDEIRVGTSWTDVSSEIPTGVSHERKNLPSNFSLAQNYPNPFNPETHISFDLTEQARVALIVYNAKGQMVRTLVNEVMNSGTHYVTFNGSNLPSGVYFYKLQTNHSTQVKKMILMK